jgi:hypothetical protein
MKGCWDALGTMYLITNDQCAASEFAAAHGQVRCRPLTATTIPGVDGELTGSVRTWLSADLVSEP